MKGNIMKLSIFVGVPVIALFMTVVIASAGPAIPYGINGVYEVTGVTTCDPTGPGIAESTYTFRNDGTGSFKGIGRSLLGGESCQPTNASRCDFTYTVTKEGRIEFQYPFPPGGVRLGYEDEDGVFHYTGPTMDGGPSHGFISPDGKTITITCGPPISLNVIDPDTGEKLFGPVWCITSLAGMRVK